MARTKRMAECHPERPHSAKGKCKQCYAETFRRKRGIQARPRLSIEQKLERQTDRASPDGCWIWTGGFGQWGVPCTWHQGRTRSMRRLVWELKTKSEPAKNRWVTPTCGTSACLNPAHLALRSIHDVVSKFWEKVDRRGPDECWPWKGDLQKGYGRFHSYNDQNVFAHRFSYELHHGKIEGHVPHTDQELCVCHRCDNPCCVNPSHLFLGTDQDNHDDMVSKGRHARGEKLSRAVRAAHARRKAQVEMGAMLSNSEDK